MDAFRRSCWAARRSCRGDPSITSSWTIPWRVTTVRTVRVTRLAARWTRTQRWPSAAVITASQRVSRDRMLVEASSGVSNALVRNSGIIGFTFPLWTCQPCLYLYYSRDKAGGVNPPAQDFLEARQLQEPDGLGRLGAALVDQPQAEVIEPDSVGDEMHGLVDGAEGQGLGALRNRVPDGVGGAEVHG